ncbi:MULTISPECIES: hypothetical protein [Burkholderia]|uniref:Uncharacterized protein n=3 Tax=Burkholderia cepacia complex TaxID=87882 RepID=A0AAP1YAW7_9BURK|nr:MULTISPECIES: hypothetical protein [Burkholderia]MBK1902039.1 hypothetical protein [Burkholderia contaminans]MBK1910322.1 hypothetical protein [Burkholderia contaminans]MBK1923781.1 hypothetical protein [Burkholderia contaminans]MBK1931993.1 hypothetical protein [Burkholderia contaminans]MBK1939242.1 hypothetical protein [Burkholderia contaminans]
MLTNALIAALAATTLVCIGGARIWYLQHICYRRWIQHHKVQDQESKAALEVLQRRFFRLATVIDSYAGGISTRLSESANVVATLHSRNPAFFLELPDLGHWLDANDKYLSALSDASSDWLDPRHREKVHRVQESGKRHFDIACQRDGTMRASIRLARQDGVLIVHENHGSIGVKADIRAVVEYLQRRCQLGQDEVFIVRDASGNYDCAMVRDHFFVCFLDIEVGDVSTAIACAKSAGPTAMRIELAEPQPGARS